jgi:hypothetical protein
MTQTVTAPSTTTAKQPHQENPRKKYFVLAFLTVLVYGYTKSIVNFRYGAEKLDVPRRDIAVDIWYIIAASLINLAFRPIFNFFFSDYIVKRIKAQNLPDETLRIKKSKKQGKDAIVYTLTFIWGVIVVNGTRASSVWIGGTGQCKDISGQYPFVDYYEGVRWYLIFQFGHHL